MGGPIHVIGGPNEARVTIYSQQCRAINLVCALRERDPELAGKSIAIVGAGAAGMTAATALRAIGVPERQIAIYECAASPLYTQRASYGRFLHPRLFHWPEPGWDDGRAGLPVADWSAEYAAAVRDRILADCASLPIRFCTYVESMERRGEHVRIRARPLDHRVPNYATFDLVLVATGFPVEPKVNGTLGGTYWHGLDGLDDLRGEVHVVGDGDGALTEVLTMLIDRHGHAVVEQLCRELPLHRLDELHIADLEAQGKPSPEANPKPSDVASWRLEALLHQLARKGPRSVVIHAKHPLSGKSFLLNRALVSHWIWASPPLVRLARGPNVAPKDALLLGENVIWRVGVGAVAKQPFAEAHMTSRGLIAELEHITAQLERRAAVGLEAVAPPKPFDLGLLTGLLDGLRRPMWTGRAGEYMRSGLQAMRRWDEPKVESLHPSAGRPTPAADQLLRILMMTRTQLQRLGVADTFAIEWNKAIWVSIDVLARAGSCPHAHLVEPGPPRIKVRVDPRVPDASVVAPRRARLRSDPEHRLWFELPDDASDSSPPDAASTGPSRSAVCSLVTPRDVAEWAEDPKRGGRERRNVAGRQPELQVSTDVLRGLSDVAGSHVAAQLQLAALFEQLGDWDGARTAFVRASRQPGGKRRAGARHAVDTGVFMNESFRRVLLAISSAIARMRPGDRTAGDHAIWLMLAAAAANLVTLTDDPQLRLELQTTAAFLTGEWAPRVRRMLGSRGVRDRDRDRYYTQPPEWAMALSAAATDLWPGASPEAKADQLGVIRELANEAARQGHEATPEESLLTLSELGVWPPGTGLDQELRSSDRRWRGNN